MMWECLSHLKRINVCSWKTDPSGHWWWLRAIPQCLAGGSLDNFSAMSTLVGSWVSNFCGLCHPESGGTNDHRRSKYSVSRALLTHLPKDLHFFNGSVTPDKDGLANWHSSSKATWSFRNASPIHFSETWVSGCQTHCWAWSSDP